MIFRKPPKRRADAFRDESPRMRRIRHVVILALLAGVLWGLWENTNRIPASRTEPPAPEVRVSRLSQAEAAVVAEYADRFQKEYGLPIVIEVRADPPGPRVLNALAGIEAPGGEPRRVVLVLCPPERRAFFLAPPAVLQALGDDAQALAGPLFVPYFASGDWRSGLQEALRRMAVRLDAAFPRRN